MYIWVIGVIIMSIVMFAAILIGVLRWYNVQRLRGVPVVVTVSQPTGNQTVGLQTVSTTSRSPPIISQVSAPERISAPPSYEESTSAPQPNNFAPYAPAHLVK